MYYLESLIFKKIINAKTREEFPDKIEEMGLNPKFVMDLVSLRNQKYSLQRIAPYKEQVPQEWRNRERQFYSYAEELSRLMNS